MRIKTIYIISLFIIIYLFVIISFNLKNDIEQDDIIKCLRTDVSTEAENFTNIEITINNIYENPHNFTINYYADNSYIDSDTVHLEPGNRYSNSRLFGIDDVMNASFVVILDNQTEPFDEIIFDFHERNQG